jgi:hypothetical protein
MDTDLADVARRLLETAKRLDNLPSSAVAERLDLREQLRALQSRARKLHGRVSVDLTTEVEHCPSKDVERQVAKWRMNITTIQKHPQQIARVPFGEIEGEDLVVPEIMSNYVPEAQGEADNHDRARDDGRCQQANSEGHAWSDKP